MDDQYHVILYEPNFKHEYYRATVISTDRNTIVFRTRDGIQITFNGMWFYEEMK